ncbi:MAG: TrkH family potassium uptake protein [Hyphomonadaceae bacterium]|nr:TrkH family potassium uptake protein [Hyphomonadaceae bacterium]
MLYLLLAGAYLRSGKCFERADMALSVSGIVGPLPCRMSERMDGPWMHFRAILLALGIMILLLAGAMVPCALVDIAWQNGDWPVFGISAFAAGIVGLSLYVLARGESERTGQREAFLLIVLVWVTLPVLAAVPFIASGMSVTDAMFESVSGLTTTGATVLTGLDNLPKGLLLWRAILQWIGGIGIIVTAIAILPQLRIGGMQLFQIESSDQSGKFMPRVRDITGRMGMIYLLVSAVCAMSYWASGMDVFDAVAHSMTTVSAGGFSTHDLSFGHFNGTPAIYFACFFMIVAGLPFSLLAMTVFEGRIRALWDDPQPRLFIALVLVFSLIIVGLHELQVIPPTFENRLHAFRDALFNIVSVMTGTGYASAIYDGWGDPVIAIFLVATFLGGCAGSAACGIKMFRLEIGYKAVIAHSRKMIVRRQVVPIRYDGRTVDQDTLQSVMVFVFLYMATFLTAAVLLGVMGEDAITAISGAATAVSNVGPGLGGKIGPSATFQTLGDPQKWVCIISMLLGRLEFVPVFAVLTRRFWTA